MNNKKIDGKRRLALLLVMLMCISLFPVSAFAEEPETDLSQNLSYMEEESTELTDDLPDSNSVLDEVFDGAEAESDGFVDGIENGDESATSMEEEFAQGEPIDNSELVTTSEETDTIVEEQLEDASLTTEETEDFVIEESETVEIFSDASKGAVIHSGTCGEDLTWTLDNGGTLTVSGTGAMTNYSWIDNRPEARPWDEYRDFITELVVKDGVIALGTRAFYQLTSLQRVRLPEGIISLPEFVFCQCIGLTEINIPSSLTTLGNECLWNTGIGTLTIPATVTNVYGHFYGGPGGATSKRIEIASGHPNFATVDGVLFTKDLKTLVMYPCYDQVTYTVPNGTTAIREHAFAYNFELETIYIPASVSFIGGFAFHSNLNEPIPLHDIYYGGTKNAWKEAFVNPTADKDTMQHVTVHCADGDIFPNGEESGPHKDEWVKINGEWYYYDASGKILKNGWAKDSGGWCWLGSDGKQVENKWIKSGGAWYYINGSGHRIENGWAKDSGGWCWLGADGKQVENRWISTGGAWYYINGSGHRIENGWAKDSGGWCWLGSDGKQVENKWIKSGGAWYYINESGHRIENGWTKDSGGWCWLGSDGKQVENRWISTGGAWYYIDGNGHRIENGWAKDSGGWCWLGSDGKQVENKWIKSGSAWYYINGSGHRIENGWAKDSGGCCWLGSDGKQVENKWIKSGGAWYYINGSGHRIENGWAKDSGGWCWLGSDGKQIESQWIETGGKKYYIDANGHRVTGKQTINGKNYTFDSNGVFVA